MVNEGLVAGQRRGSGQARVSLMELVQLEEAGFETVFEGGKRGCGHGRRCWKRPSPVSTLPSVCKSWAIFLQSQTVSVALLGDPYRA
jgi:hypothetical protein